MTKKSFVLHAVRFFLALILLLCLAYRQMESHVLSKVHCEAQEFWQQLDKYVASIRLYYRSDKLFLLTIDAEWMKKQEFEIAQMKTNSQKICGEPNPWIASLGFLYPDFQKQIDRFQNEANIFQQENHRLLEKSWSEQNEWRSAFTEDMDKVSFLCEQKNKFEKLDRYLNENCRTPASVQSQSCTSQEKKISAILEEQTQLFDENFKKLKSKWPIFSSFIDEHIHSCRIEQSYD